MLSKSPVPSSKSPEKDSIFNWLSLLESSNSSFRNKEAVNKILSQKNELVKQINQNSLFKDIITFLSQKVEEKQISDEQFSPIRLRSPFRSPISSATKKDDELNSTHQKKREATIEEIITKRKKIVKLRRNLKEKSITFSELNGRKKELQDHHHFLHFRKNLLCEFDNIRDIFIKFINNSVFHTKPTNNDHSFTVPNIFEQAIEANLRIQDLTHKTKLQIDTFKNKVIKQPRNSLHNIGQENELISPNKKNRIEGSVPEEIINLTHKKRQRFWQLFEINEKKSKELFVNIF